MGCPYVTVTPYKEHPLCSINGRCLQMWRCDKDLAWKPLSGMDNCPLKIKEQNKHLSQGYYKVLFIKKKKAYVQVGNIVIAVPYDGANVDVLHLEYINNEYVVIKD